MKILHIHGKRWFDRRYGNTYHSVDIWIDGLHYCYIPMSYGYGDNYIQSAKERLQKDGKLKDIPSFMSLSLYCRDNGIRYVSHVTDVKRKRDL